MLRALLPLVSALMWLIAIAAPSPSVAQTQATPPTAPVTAPPATPSQPRAFLPPKAKTEAPQPPSGPLAGLYAWISAQQHAITRTLASALRDIKAGNAWAASLVLIGFSFAYGVLHAAGPGHGKAIVSSYMLADGQTVRRGIQLAFLSSIVQAFSAIALFAVVVGILSGARSQITTTEAWLERASWAIVAGFGLWLMIRQIRALISGRSAHDHHHHGHAHDHAHRHHAHAGHAHDHHAHSHEAHGPEPALVGAGAAGGSMRVQTPVHGHAHRHEHHGHEHHGHEHHGHEHHGHEHHRQGHHGHGHHGHRHGDHGHAHLDHAHHAHGPGESCSACGHAHMPTAEAVQGEWSWRRAATLALAIGIRPCTGAIGVLFVANGLGLLWAGVASTFVMAIGTAITVSALAALTVGSRDWATRLAGVSDNSWASRVQTLIGLVGATLVFLLGATFFYYSLSAPQPF